jgi:two-component system, cell cycle sensor histidine kinase and response regulator CckA
MPDPAKVLVIDDDADIAGMVCEVLEEDGYELVCLSSADEAVNELLGEDDFDALVTDLDLGGAIDGFHLAHLARKHRPDAAIIYTSGAAAGRVRHERVADAVFIAKPFSPFEVKRALKQMLAKIRGSISPKAAPAR